MKRLLFIVTHSLYGIVLGYFFNFALMHFASINMQSDDNLNQAGMIGLLIWPIIVILASWLGNEFYRNNITKLKKAGYLFLSLLTGFVFADFAIGYSFYLFEWDTKIHVNWVFVITATTWIVFAILTAFIANIFLISHCKNSR